MHVKTALDMTLVRFLFRLFVLVVRNKLSWFCYWPLALSIDSSAGSHDVQWNVRYASAPKLAP